MARIALKALAWTIGLVAAVLLVAAALAYVLLETQPGHDFALRMALNQAPNHVDGAVRVGALRSDGLLRGFTLHGVSIHDDRGRPFVEADSLRVRYSFRELLRGQVALVPAEAWAPRIVLESLHGDEHLNAVRIFRLHEPRDPAAEPSGVSLLLQQMTIHDGTLLVRLPLDDGAEVGRGVIESIPETEGLYRRLELSGIDALVREAELIDPAGGGQRVRFDRLALTGHVFDDPFRIEDFRGVATLFEGRIGVEAEYLRMPESELVGELAMHPGGDNGETILEISATVRSERLSELRWIEPRIPEGRGHADLEVSGPLSRSEWRISNADLEVEDSRMRGALGFDLGEELRLVGADLELLPLQLRILDDWLEEPLPFEGRLRGWVRATGPFRALRVDVDVTFDDEAGEIPSSSLRADGVVSLGETLSVEGLVLEVDPLRYATLRAFDPDLDLVGEGRLRVEASGGLATGLMVSGELSHRASAVGVASRVTASGSVLDRGDGLVLDLTGNLSPLSFAGLEAGLRRELPLAGEVSGPVRATGSLNDLNVEATLNTLAGMLAFSSRMDAMDPAAGYSAEGRVQDFALHRVLAGVPDPTVVTGAFEVDGRGFTAEEMMGRARLDLAPVLIVDAELDRVEAAVRAEEGRLLIDAFEVRSAFGSLDGSGDLALREGVAAGRVSVLWETEALDELRPLILGDRVIAADTLTGLEREILRIDGIDPDTLPDAEAIVLGGRASGWIELRGAIHDLDADLFAELEDGVYGDTFLDGGRARVAGHWRGRDDWSAAGTVALERFGFGRYAFEQAGGEIEYRPREGEARIRVRRDVDEEYFVGGTFEFDGAGVDIALDSLTLDLEPMAWSLDGSSRIRVEDRTLRVDAIRVTRPAFDDMPPVRIDAAGVLALDGESDFRTEMWGVDIHQLAEILHFDDPPRGTLDLTLDVRGPAEAPEMEGRLVLHDLTTGEVTLSRVEGTLAYRDRLADAQLEADIGGRRLLRADGRVPVDLTFRQVEDRFPDREIELTVAVDSLPAASIFAFLDVVDDVDGVLDGRIDVRGTPRELRPSGEVQLRGGAASLPEQGLRLTGITGDFQLGEDRVVQVAATAQARGTARMSGFISLEDLADPGFDLRIVTSNFQAIDRRDMSARVGGEIMLTGSYTRPLVQGLVRVEQGQLFLEEFARTAEVVDLTDPAFFDVVDTTVVAVRPIVAAAENPFVRNLRVDVDLAIERDFWLRSREMNVEMDGELMVTFDRPRREILLVGSLEAVRGSYTAFGRQFQVQEGMVEFMGTPGINPSLDIQAVNRVRREGGEPLNVVAQLGGTLENMRVDLSSDSQPPIGESDLISYLIFGRPSYALGSGERSVLEGAAGAGVGVVSGLVATQLGAVVAQQFGVDYFTITQAREDAGLPSGAGLAGSLVQTQIEMGQYVGQNLFLALTLRPLTGLGTRTQTQFPGARLEWRFTDLWTAEGFLEDRFAREATAGFGDLGLRLDKVLGFSIYREWGY